MRRFLHHIYELVILLKSKYGDVLICVTTLGSPTLMEESIDKINVLILIRKKSSDCT